jgi:hypothetical protein
VRELGLRESDFAEIARRVAENAEGPDAADTLAILNLYRE